MSYNALKYFVSFRFRCCWALALLCLYLLLYLLLCTHRHRTHQEPWLCCEEIWKLWLYFWPQHMLLYIRVSVIIFPLPLSFESNFSEESSGLQHSKDLIPPLCYLHKFSSYHGYDFQLICIYLHNSVIDNYTRSFH